MKKLLLCMLTLVFVLPTVSVFAYNTTDVVGHTTPQLTNKDANKLSTNLGTTVASALNSATGADIGLINADSLKGNIVPGAITFAEVQAALIPGYEVVKYDNVLGSVIKAAISSGSVSAGTPTNPLFAHVAGITVASIVDANTYKVATIREISTGTDVYTQFDGLTPSVDYIPAPLADEVSAYLTAQIPVGITVTDINAAEAVTSLIKTVDSTKVTIADKTKVNEIFAAYNALTENQKTLVIGASNILLSQNNIAELETLAAIEAAIVKAEQSGLQANVDSAKALIDGSLFSDTIDRDAMFARLSAIVIKTLPKTGESFMVVYGLMGLTTILGAAILVQRKRSFS